MQTLRNPFRGAGLEIAALANIPAPSTDARAVADLLAHCPDHATTAMRDATDLARAAGLGLGALWVKDESTRMGLGSFKALGAAYVIARDAQSGTLAGVTYVAASAGNHGLSIAAGARVFGARAVIYLSEAVPEAFAARLRAQAAEVVRAGVIYEASLAAAIAAARANGWQLLADTSWPGYTERPYRVMEGYLQLMAEAGDQLDEAPTHIFLHAGVGGLAGSAAAMARVLWGDRPRIVVVEPDAAPALHASIKAGGPVVARGPVSIMGRLDCKEPSLIALKGLARDADDFVLITEDEAQAGTELAVRHGLASTPSGTAGLAAVLLADDATCADLELDARARVLTILSEGPET